MNTLININRSYDIMKNTFIKLFVHALKHRYNFLKIFDIL